MCLWQKARALSPFWFKGTDLEMARHTSSWECDSQQMASTIKLNRPPVNQGKKALFVLQTILPLRLNWNYLMQWYGPELEKTEMHLLIYILHLPPSATSMAVCRKLGQSPLHLLWKERILRYWNRLCSEEIPDLLKEVAWMHLGNKDKRAVWQGCCMSLAFTPTAKDVGEK